MSANLLVEFDDFYSTTALQNQGRRPDAGVVGHGADSHTPATGPSQTSSILDDDESWGVFEEPVSSQTTLQTFQASNDLVRHSQSRADNELSERHPPKPVRASTIELFSSNIADLAESQKGQQRPNDSRHPKTEKQPNYAGVMFDAENVSDDPDDDDDDDFGEFTSGTATDDLLMVSSPMQTAGEHLAISPLNNPPKKPPEPLISLLSDDTGPFPYPSAPPAVHPSARTPLASLATSVPAGVKRSEPRTATPVTAWPHISPVAASRTEHDNEAWDAFEDSPSRETSVPFLPKGTGALSLPKSQITASSQPSLGDSDLARKMHLWKLEDSIGSEVNAAIPTNIPPPSVLLPLFVGIFAMPQELLLQPVTGPPHSLKDRILSDPAALEFLRSFLFLAVVAGRVLAGRKLRWKRDAHLAQAMKIGPAVAGGKGGMKLTGVDKTEGVKEDREATDVVTVWKAHLGRLRSAISMANGSIKDDSATLTIPALEGDLIVKTLRGALTSPKPCLLCGLKRDERVNIVESSVEDSFGEWWVEHWGHRTCRNFWTKYEQVLSKR